MRCSAGELPQTIVEEFLIRSVQFGFAGTVSRMCGLQSIVVQETVYNARGEDTTTILPIFSKNIIFISYNYYFQLQDKPMGAVSVFMVGNYLNQPSEMTSALRDVVASPVFFE